MVHTATRTVGILRGGTSAGTWSSRNPGPVEITAETRAAVRRLLAEWRPAPESLRRARTPPGLERDSVLEELETSMQRRDSKGSWQNPKQGGPEAFTIFCVTCSPSKKGRILYFKSLEAWREHAFHAHCQPDACFKQSSPGDPVRAGAWYCSQCSARS